MTTLNIIDISHVENYCPQGRLVPDELQNCHAHYKWDRQVWEVAYYHGYREPRYPVPAIRQGFEFGLRLRGGVTLLHWTQGPY